MIAIMETYFEHEQHSTFVESTLGAIEESRHTLCKKENEKYISAGFRTHVIMIHIQKTLTNTEPIAIHRHAKPTFK